MTEPVVNVESENGTTRIEVRDEKRADDVVKNLLDALSPTVGDAHRIYVELDSGDVTDEEDEATDETGTAGPPDEDEERRTITPGTAMHAVGWTLRKHGPSVVSDIASRIDDYPVATVSSTLTEGKNGGLIHKEASPEGTSSRWSLTDWGQEQVTEVGEYE